MSWWVAWFTQWILSQAVRQGCIEGVGKEGGRGGEKYKLHWWSVFTRLSLDNKMGWTTLNWDRIEIELWMFLLSWSILKNWYDWKKERTLKSTEISHLHSKNESEECPFMTCPPNWENCYACDFLSSTVESILWKMLQRCRNSVTFTQYFVVVVFSSAQI